MGSTEFIPPPVELDSPPLAAAPATNLRSVIKSAPGASHSVSYPALRAPTKRPFQEKPIESWTAAGVADWLDGLQP